MRTITQSDVFMNPDGYVEMVFHGVVYHDALQRLVRRATHLIAKNGPIKVLIDGRCGAIDRKAKTFRILMGLGYNSKLKDIIIITSNDPTKIDAIQGPSIVSLMLSSAFGFKPVYIADEKKARKKAMTNT